MSKPKGYNVSKIEYLKDLNKEQLVEVLERVLEHLELEVYTDTTPDYTEIFVQKKSLPTSGRWGARIPLNCNHSLKNK
jgi:ethanolamine utilization protein EutA (predicted chaperonin)